MNQDKPIPISYTVQWSTKSRNSHIELSYSDSFDKVKRKLLKDMGFLVSNKDRVTLYIKTTLPMNSRTLVLYPAVALSTPDFITICLRQQQKYGRTAIVELKGENLQQRRYQRQKERVVEFDSDGSVDSIDPNYSKVKPSNPVYRGKDTVVCVFCERPSSDKNYIRLNGPFYGPFVSKSYCHLLCAIWSPKVYLHETTDALMNMDKEIKRCKKVFCHYCGKAGGATTCSTARCPTTAHFNCAIDEECELDWQNYVIKCLKCLKQEKKSSRRPEIQIEHERSGRVQKNEDSSGMLKFLHIKQQQK